MARNLGDADSVRAADYLLTVKANQPTLFARVKALPWAQAPVLEATRERTHGRTEVRTASTGRVGRSYAYLVTSLLAERVTDGELAHLARGH